MDCNIYPIRQNGNVQCVGSFTCMELQDRLVHSQVCLIQLANPTIMNPTIELLPIAGIITLVLAIIVGIGLLTYSQAPHTPAEQKQQAYYDCVCSSVVNHAEEKIKYCDDIK